MRIYLQSMKETNHELISQLLVGERKYLKGWNINCTLNLIVLPIFFSNFLIVKIDIDFYIQDNNNS